MRTCAMVGCSNSDYKLEKMWKTECVKHKVIMGKDGCDCKPQFRLLPFPLEKTDPKLRALWTKMVNRIEPGSDNQKWTPREQSRICTDHFKAGCPYPTLKLGYKAKALKERPERKGRKIVAAASRCSSKKIRQEEAPSPVPACHVSPALLLNATNSDTDSDKDASDRHTLPHNDHNYVVLRTRGCEGCLQKEHLIEVLKSRITELENELYAFHNQLADDPGALGQWRGCRSIAEFRQKNHLSSESSKRDACAPQEIAGTTHNGVLTPQETTAGTTHNGVLTPQETTAVTTHNSVLTLLQTTGSTHEGAVTQQETVALGNAHSLLLLSEVSTKSET